MAVTFLGSFLSFGAVVLLVFVLIGQFGNHAITRNVALFRLDVSNATLLSAGSGTQVPDFIDLGQFAYCEGTYAQGITDCSDRAIGYDLDSTRGVGLLLRQQNIDLKLHTFTRATGITFIAAMGSAAITWLFGLCAHTGRPAMLISSCMALFAFICSLAQTIILFVGYGVAKAAIRENSNANAFLSTEHKNASWLTLASTVLLFLASISFCIACCIGRRSKSNF